MRHTILFLLLTGSILSSFASQAQDYFTVLVGNFVEVRPQDFAAARSLGFVYKQVAEGNMQQVYVGNYTDQDKATAVANALRNQGFTNAQISRRTLVESPDAIVIQIATRFSNRSINWAELGRVGDMNVTIEDERIKVMTGTFPDLTTAQNTLANIRALGFEDAFVKSVPSNQLLPVTSLSTGIKEDLIPLQPNNETNYPSSSASDRVITPTESASQDGRISTNAPPAISRPTVPGATPTPSIPGNDTRVVVPSPAPSTAGTQSKGDALPAIRGNVKRNSVLNLQRLLQDEGYYNSSLDGLYGSGTSTAYTQMITQDRNVQKYRLLVPFYTVASLSTASGALQQAIDELPYSPVASATIQAGQNATAMVYQAYLSYTTRGPSAQVDQLMNTAIKQAYAGSSISRGGFDYRATYAYRDLTQLLLHLHYVHAAPNNPYTLPCWISSQHPNEINQVNQQLLPGTPTLKWSACDPFLAWEEIQLLQTIAFDINPSAIQATTKLQAAAAQRSQLFMKTTPLSIEQGTLLESWQQNLWQKIDRWATTDVFLAETAQSLRLAYLQTLVRLEDFYMDKGFTTIAARHLAIATLKTIAGAPLERF